MSEFEAIGIRVTVSFEKAHIAIFWIFHTILIIHVIGRLLVYNFMLAKLG